MAGNYQPTLEHPAPANIGSASVIYGSGAPTGTKSLPGTLYVDNVGDLLWFTSDGSTWTQVGGSGSGSGSVLSGTGNPNGVVTATEPAVYYDKSTNILYEKTGSGNLGWNA